MAPTPARASPLARRTTVCLSLGLLALAAAAAPASAAPQPCAGVVDGAGGLLVDLQYGVYVQAGAPGGPTAYAGYDERCEGRDLLDLSGYIL